MSGQTDPGIVDAMVKVLPGFLGSVVAAIYLQRPVNKLEGLISILSGFFTSVFVTPYVVSIFAPGNVHAMAGIGYGIGLTTVVLLPPIIRRAQEVIASLSLADILGVGKKKE